MKVFWSWQNDYSPKECRFFIKKALEEAVKKVGEELQVEDADRPSLDHDTKGESGMVDIAATILQKISESAVFVADLTPISKSDEGKYIPNPNVCIELGWAMQKPGVNRIIVVLNAAEGCTEKDLPFDISHRRIMSYNLPKGADNPTRAKVKEQLVRELTQAILTNLKEHIEETPVLTEILGVPENPKDPSIWESDNGKLVHPGGGNTKKTIHLLGCPRSYVRVIPSGWKNDIPLVGDIESSMAIGVEPITHQYSNGDYGICDKGFVRYWFTGETEKGVREPKNVSLFFDETGEFWVLHGGVVVNHEGKNYLSSSWLLKGWKKHMQDSLAVFDKFEAHPVRKVKVGLFGVKDVFLAPDHGTPPFARKNEIVLERTDKDWSEEAQLSFLQKAFNKALDLFGLSGVSQKEIQEKLKG
jgi:hypothetical protein